jgi:hypothetical protein
MNSVMQLCLVSCTAAASLRHHVTDDWNKVFFHEFITLRHSFVRYSHFL